MQTVLRVTSLKARVEQAAIRRVEPCGLGVQAEDAWTVCGGRPLGKQASGASMSGSRASPRLPHADAERGSDATRVGMSVWERALAEPSRRHAFSAALRVGAGAWPGEVAS